ncbi:MAG: ABC transporter permease [Polyangiaceae bacterium]|nr:ABC transporter permease [Polyangiaceae bacterium]
MRNEPHPLWELTKVRLREFVREKGAIFWVFLFPLLMAVALGLAFRSRPPDLPRIAVVAERASPSARALLNSNRVQAISVPAESADRALGTGKVDLVADLTARGPRLVFDPTRERGPTARLIVEDVLQRAAGRRDELSIRSREITEPGSRYIDFLLPGLIGLNVMGSSMWGVGYNLVLARKRRLLRRYAVTPMRRSHFLLSYFFSRSFFLILEVGVLLAFGHFVFGTVVRGSLSSLALVTFLGAASFAAISLLIGARVDNTESANGWMNFVQMPMWLLSGAFFSYDRFPEWLHGPIRALPLTAIVDALRAISNEGATLIGCGTELLVLSVWCALGFVVALKTFRWQ